MSGLQCIFNSSRNPLLLKKREGGFQRVLRVGWSVRRAMDHFREEVIALRPSSQLEVSWAKMYDSGFVIA